MSSTATVTFVTYNPVSTRPLKLKAKGYAKKMESPETAIAYFEAKLAKWTERVSTGGKIDILIPNIAFRAYMPNGFSMYYELVL